MTFAWPHLLWLLALPVALLGWELSRRRRAATSSGRPKILRAEAGMRSLKLASFGVGQPETRLATPRFWLFLGLIFAIVAIARPQWGRLEEPIFDQSREILLAIDLSRSMQATDVKPSRLDRSKLLIQSLLEKLQGERVGLVVFAGTAFLQSPLSADYEILREFLPSLGPDYLPQGGSDYNALLEASIRAFSTTSAADRFLVILSDGEATDTEWRKQLDELKNKNIRVLGLGVGTPDGSMIPDGSGGLIKDDRGAVVLSKLESATLQELAQATGGVYRDASAWVDLAGLVSETIESGRKGQFLEKNTIRLAERFQWPLAFALWCLLLSFYYEFPVRPRVRDLKLDTGNGLPEAGKKAVTTVAALLLLASCFLYPVSSYAAAKLATPAASAPAEEESPLARVIGRIAMAEKASGRDYAELARETITWGSRLQSEKRGVPQPPIRDALAGVALGTKLDPKTADWTKLRDELEALLDKEEEKKDEEKKDQDQQQQNQDQQQDQNQQKQDNQKQDQKQKQKSDQKDSEKQDGKSEKNEQGQGEQDQKQKQDPQQQDESAFGDMSKKDQPPPPPPPQDNMQQVGGAEKESAKQPPADPALAIPLQKLDQLRTQDSPAHLFQLMETDKDKRAPKKPTKDW